jgi:hypothetical protein
MPSERDVSVHHGRGWANQKIDAQLATEMALARSSM